MTTSMPSRFLARAEWSISYVLPTPGAAPTKMRNLPMRRSSRRAASRSASGEGRCSVSCRGSAIHIRYYQIGGSNTRLCSLAGHLIECEIKQEHVDARLAEKAQQPPLGMVGDKLADAFF